MEIFDTITQWIAREPSAALAAALGLYLFLLALVLCVLVRQARLPSRRTGLARSWARPASVPGTGRDGGGAGSAGPEDTVALRRCLQKIGLVRYDAFSTVAGEQSFSAAILDAEGSGIVLSVLYTRTDVRVYAKPVVLGETSLTLTEEEQAAIAQAMSGSGPEATEPSPALVGESVPGRGPSSRG